MALALLKTRQTLYLWNLPQFMLIRCAHDTSELELENVVLEGMSAFVMCASPVASHQEAHVRLSHYQ